MGNSLIKEEIEKMRKMMGLNEQSNPLQFNEQGFTSDGNPMGFNDDDEEDGYSGEEEGGESPEIKNMEPINKAYTHFAMNKKDGKIYTGWEYDQDLDTASIKYYCTNDLKDWFGETNRPSDFTVLTRRGCIQKGLNPFDTNNWKHGI